MLLVLTATYADGRTKKLVLNSSEIREIIPDDRGTEYPSKSIIFRKDGFKYYVTEEFEFLLNKLERE